MKNLMIGIGVVVAVIAICFMVIISIKNGLIAQDEAVEEQWSEISNQLQRRADLIPNLVATVKGYAAHEEKVFADVSNARASLLSARGPEESAEASAEMSGALGRLLAIAESYPQLKANETFIRLQDELAGTENRISVARTRYNKSVKAYNQRIRQFPGSIFASGMGLSAREYFNPPEGLAAIQKVPKVQF